VERILVQENQRQHKLAQEGLIREIGVVETTNEVDGSRAEEVVDVRRLDLTDQANLAL
jgi:hypothetical protein